MRTFMTQEVKSARAQALFHKRRDEVLHQHDLGLPLGPWSQHRPRASRTRGSSVLSRQHQRPAYDFRLPRTSAREDGSTEQGENWVASRPCGRWPNPYRPCFFRLSIHQDTYYEAIKFVLGWLRRILNTNREFKQNGIDKSAYLDIF